MRKLFSIPGIHNYSNNDTLKKIKEQLIDKTLVIFSIAGLAAAIVSFFNRNIQEIGYNFFILTGIYLLLVSITALRKKIKLKAKGHLFAFIMISSAVIDLFYHGLMGTGSVILLAAAVIMTIIYGYRAGFKIIIFSLFIFITISTLIDLKIIQYSKHLINNNSDITSWVMVLTSLILFMLIFIFDIGKMHSYLITAILDSEEKSFQLDQLNKKLHQESSVRLFTEKNLIDSGSKYRALFEQATDSIILLDYDTKEIIDLNNSAAILINQKDLYNKKLKISELNFEISKEELFDKLEDTYKNLKCYFETTFINDDGDKKNIHVNAISLRVSDRNIIQLIIRDITIIKEILEEKINIERKIQQSQKLESLGLLAGGIAHDFNNLLMGILGNADLALDIINSNCDMNQYLSEIKKTSIMLSDLTNQMLAYSGKGQFIKKPHNLSNIVEEISQLLEISILKKAFVRYYLDYQIPNINAENTQLRQVIMNLITNAAESIEGIDGEINIRTGQINIDENNIDEFEVNFDLKRGNYVFLEVSDDGCGIEKEVISKIFDPFYTTKFTGRGLGLAAVLGIIKGHNGYISVKSVIGEGTTFTVFFPICDTFNHSEHCDEEISIASLKNVVSGKFVLLVDDEETVLNIAEKMLNKIGFKVIKAINGEEAVKIFKEKVDTIDLILVDLTMPKMNGIETYDAISKIKSDVPVILSSGYNEQEISEKFSLNKISAFLKKPYEFKMLENKINKIIC